MRLRLLMRALAGALLLCPPALATWSVVVVNKSTGEVCCASATCIGGYFPLKNWVAVIVVGRGAAAAQSAIDLGAKNRALIWEGFQGGITPERILDELAKNVGHQSKQYGIVSFAGAPVTFTGDGAGHGKHGVVGETDELWYAIQGNVITGDVVVTEAEQALVNTPGDLGQKVMAAMEAARSMGGDGRCSCGPDPDGCGAPPPNFDKSAHTAFIVLARPGDADGICDGNTGCANGDYYLSLEYKGHFDDPDPVIELQALYDAWRLERADEADHVLSTVDLDRTVLVADGQTTASVRVQLRDLDGQPLSAGGHALEIEWIGEGTPTALPGAPIDHGAGVYSFPLTATTAAGRGMWRITAARDGERSVQLQPLVLVTEALVDLHVGRPELTLAGPTNVPFTLNRGTIEAGRGYVLLGSAAGTVPGVPFEGVVIPLNRDRFFHWTWGGADGSFEGAVGILDERGRAEASLDLLPGGWAPLVGETVAFSALLAGPPYAVTQVATVRIVP